MFMSKNDMGGMGVVASNALNPTPSIHPLAYRPKDACRIIGVGRTKLNDLINSGQLTRKKIGKKVTVILHAELEKLLAD
jgi:hypothetical protein